jgi:hypothetical protein
MAIFNSYVSLPEGTLDTRWEISGNCHPITFRNEPTWQAHIALVEFQPILQLHPWRRPTTMGNVIFLRCY